MEQQRLGRRLLAIGACVVVAACGSRSTLSSSSPFGAEPLDASEDGGTHPGIDASADVGAPVPGDDATDAPPDTSTPPVDAPGCTSAGPVAIYVITTSSNLYWFDPSSSAFHLVGALNCNFIRGTNPNSMAVDRTNTAYVAFQEGTIARVDTQTAGCTSVPFMSPYPSFGMGFVRNPSGVSETLYLAAGSSLVALDVSTWTTRFVGSLSLGESELSGSPDGRLFAFDGAIHQIDPASAKVLMTLPMVNVPLGAGWAFAYWGGDFYLFTAPGQTSSTVLRVHPSDGSTRQVGTLDEVIVGAGVSTCAP